MHLTTRRAGLLLALSIAAPALTQSPGDVPSQERPAPAADQQLHLKYATFDPTVNTPVVPENLLAGADTHLYIVQYPFPFADADRTAMQNAGATLLTPLPQNAIIVRMSAATAAAVAVLPDVRWVGPYQPAYRLEAQLLTELATGRVPTRRYNLVMLDKRGDKNALLAGIQALGGREIDVMADSILFRADLTGPQLVQAARLDQVLWIDCWTPEENDMNNARTVQGSNYIETVAGYRGDGIRGHVYEGVEYNHPDFTTAFTPVDSSNVADNHGHCTAGCIFGNGTSSPNARGHAPNAVGFFTNYSAVTGGLTRNQVINDVVNTYNCMFTTASWGNTPTTQYTSISADADDIVFDHRIPWTQSMSNQGSTLCRPQAWAKNILSIGGIFHRDNSNPADDGYSYTGQPFGSASVGPAADGRIKPDLCNFYDSVWTSDRSGAAGYSSGNSYSGFNGTSAATPITAGTNALLIQMFTDFLFGNQARVAGGTRFQNRPYAQTVKALQIACASQYTLAQGTRYQQGWGYPNLQTMYDRRARMFLVPEDAPITQGATHSYQILVAPGETSLKVCMSYCDPMGNVAAAQSRINDLTLRVVHPNGTTSYWGNNGLTGALASTSGGAANTLDTVECVFVNNPAAGVWTVEVTAPTVAQDAHLATAAVDADYALVVNGGVRTYSGCARYIPDNDPTTGTVNVVPFGTDVPAALTTLFAQNNGLGNPGNAVFFDVAVTNDFYWHGLDVNTATTVGTPITADIYTRVGTYAGSETTAAGWSNRTCGHGVAAAVDSPSRIDFNDPLYMAAGTTYGVCVVARDFHTRYTSGANSYGDANMTLSLGSAMAAPFAPGIVNTPRTANVSIVYRADTAAYHNELYQTILRRDDLGPAGTITGLAFAPSQSGRHMNRFLVVTMSQVPMGHVMSTTFANNLPAPVTVLNATDYSWELTGNAWNDVGLAAGFGYDGAHDVVVQILARANHSTATPGGFHRGGDVERVYATGWPFTAQPATGARDTAGTKLRVQFNCAAAGSYGTACGYVSAAPSGSPLAGGSFGFEAFGSPNNGAIIMLGLTSQSVTLHPYGFTNCWQWTDGVATTFHPGNPAGHMTHAVAIPNTAAFNGLMIYGQWFQLDGTQPGGLSASNYVRALIGQQLP